MEILTDRLLIRIATPDDAGAIYSYRSDAVANRYQGWFPASESEVRDYLNSMPATLDVSDVCFQFAIIRKEDNLLIGDMGIVFSNHDNMQTEIGCTLRTDSQGLGYATEALRAMVNALFTTLNKRRVVASADPRNYPSIRLIERLGFRKEAHHRESYFLRGEWVDDVVYALLRNEWDV